MSLFAFMASCVKRGKTLLKSEGENVVFSLKEPVK